MAELRSLCTRFCSRARSAMLLPARGLTMLNVPHMGKLEREYEEHRVAETESDTRAVRIYMLVPILAYALGKVIGSLFSDGVELWSSAGVVIWYVFVTRGPNRYLNTHGWVMLIFITLTCIIAVLIATVYADEDRHCDDLRVWPFRDLCRPSSRFACRLKNNAYPSSYFLIVGVINFSVRHLGSVGYRLHVVMHMAQMVLLSTAALMVSARAGTDQAAHLRPFMLQWIFMDFVTCTGLLWLFEREGRVAFLQLVARSHAVQQEKMLAALLCHEIKNPLTTISYFINSLCEAHLLPGPNGDMSTDAAIPVLDGPGDNVAKAANGGVFQVDSDSRQGAACAVTAVSQLLPDAVESVAVLDKLVEDCRHLARFQSGTYELRRDKVNLRRVVESCVGTHAREREAGLKIDFIMPQDLTVVSDRLLWQHVFATLLGNAAKYSVFQAQNTNQRSEQNPEMHPRVSVRVEQDDAGHVQVQVSDTGPGISQAQQAFIVGKFAKARDTEMENDFGSGLGLHLSAKIIQLLGGQLELTSPLFSGMRGTRVNFSVPCAPAGGATGGAGERNNVLPTATGATIAETPQASGEVTHGISSTIQCLIVEDDDVNFLILKTALTTGFKKIHNVVVGAKQARTAEDALNAIGEGDASQFEVIITDEHLECAGGRMTGSALIETLYSRQWRQRKPVLIAATGNTNDSDIERYMGCGAAVVWPKPYPHMKQLVCDVMQHLHTQQPARDRANSCASPKLTSPGKVAATSEQSIAGAPSRGEDDGMEMFGILPKVPERAFRIARRQRAILDAHVLRFFFIAEFLAQLMAHEWWRHVPNYAEQSPPEWEYVLWQLIRAVNLYLVWKPARWPILFKWVKALMVIALMSRLASATTNACTADHWSNPKGYNHVCRLAERGYVDSIALSTYYVVNTMLFIYGGWPLYTQLYTMTVEVAGITIISVYTSGQHNIPRPPCMEHRVHRLSFLLSIGLCLCAILVAIERKMRVHFLENRAKQRLIDQQKNLVALLCREIRNPLRVVSTLLRKMNAAAIRHPRVEMLPDALNCTTLLFDIIENCQHLSKIENSQYEPQNDQMNLRELVNSCIGMHSREREAGLSFEVKCLSHLSIVSDRRLWLHILMNLIGNAVKFTMGEEGVTHNTASQVSVAIEQVDEDLHVSVSDTGPGIAEHEQALIYDKFTTGGRGFRTKGHGSGLGLHLSAKFVHILRGKLTLTSPLQNGRGARFGTMRSTAPASRKIFASSLASHNFFATALLSIHCRYGYPVLEFTVPNAFVETNEPVPSTPRHIESDVPSKSDALRVLSVEDDDLSYLVLQASLQTGLLQNAGVEVKTTRVRTAEEALNLLGSDDYCPFDVVVTDQHLEPAGGVLTGSEFTRLLQRREWQGTWRGATFQPVLAIASGDTEIVRMGSARDLHAQIIVWQKPYPSTTQMAKDIISRLPSSVANDLSARVYNSPDVNVHIDDHNDNDTSPTCGEIDVNNADNKNADANASKPKSGVVKSSQVLPSA